MAKQLVRRYGLAIQAGLENELVQWIIDTIEVGETQVYGPDDDEALLPIQIDEETISVGSRTSVKISIREWLTTPRAVAAFA